MKESENNTVERQDSRFADWHIRMFNKSLLKQAKLKQIVHLLGPTGGMTCLDIGSDNGVISYQLRKHGGTWHSTDKSPKAVESIRRLVQTNVTEVKGGKLPYEDGKFDAVVIVDMLEHLQDDLSFIEECHRVLKQSGYLVVNVPNKKFSVLRPIRKLLGLTDAWHGHVRSGYTESELFDVLKDGFDVQEVRTYSRFFVESVDTVIQFASLYLSGDKEGGDKGVMIDESDFRRLQNSFRFYSFVYPILWLASKLDWLLFWTRGYSLIVRAQGRPWRPRARPVLKDGRSIAEATINTKIGTAAPF